MTTLAAAAHAQRPAADTADAVDALFQEFNHPDSPGASVTVIQDAKPIFAKGYGLADLEKHVPVTTTTDFRLASVTKQFTAMAILILAERRQLSLDENLTNFFPEFPDYGKTITVRHLVTHSSGLNDYEELIPKGTEIPVLDRDVLRLLMKQDTTGFTPGARFRYSNTGYSLLALIIEARSGNTFAQFLKRNIFEPLKMEHTLAYEQGLSSVPNRAYGYSLEGGAWKRTDQSLTSSVLGDGGVYSCTADLFKWDQALFDNKLISPALQTQAFTPAVRTDKPGTGYGFGWFISNYRGLKEVWHSGNSIGFTTRIARFPEKRFSVIILANRTDAHLADMPHKLTDLFLFPDK